MKYKILSLLLLLCLLTGCVGTDDQGSSSNFGVNSTQLSQDQLFAMLFDLENKITLRLDMSDEELEKMQNDYEKYSRIGSKSPIYRMGDLHVTVTTPDGSSYFYRMEEVGVRMKGNTSRTDFYNEEDGIYNLIHLKISFQETFDNEAYYGTDARQWKENERKERKNRTFATLEKLDLRWNRCDDSTYLREYFAYETYRTYGVPAPHTNLCSFDWAGIQMGVYTINEPIDDVFLAKNLPEAALGGDLYKIGWSGSSNGSFTDTQSIGIENEDNSLFFAYDLQTNKKTSTHESLIHLIQKLNGTVTKDSFVQLVDQETFLNFCAVSYLLGNPDDLRNNYNNCYLYFRTDNGKAVLIPYDYDRCLGITAHWNPTGDGVTSDNPFSTNLNADGTSQRSPLFRCSVAAGGFLIREYADTLKTIALGQWFRYETFSQLYATAQANYADLTQPGKVFRNTEGLWLSFDLERTSDFSANGNIAFREYLDAKLETLEYYLNNVDFYADAEPSTISQWYIRSDATDWKNHEDYAMILENGLVSLRFTTQKQIRLKVYDDITGRWYGAECVSDECTASYESDGHTNIVLPSGTYRIFFDPVICQITLEKE